MLFPSYKNKNVLILGLGLLGRGLRDAIFFAEQGAKVVVTDLKTAEQLKPSVDKLKKFKNVKFVLGEHRFEDIDRADLIIRNADVPRESKFLQYAFEKKKTVDMDESLFAKYCPCPIIGVTGTRGKTTTTTLIYELLKKTGRKVYLGGNIKDMATLPLIKKVKANDIVVLELSSWQLQGFGWAKISPPIAVFTNIFPDHLNRYAGMQEYINDKKLIYQNQKPDDYLIVNHNNPETKKAGEEALSNVIYFDKKNVPKSWKLKILGEHNLENIDAAIKVAAIFKLPAKTIKQVVEKFGGVEHRLEFVKTVKGVDFINDSTSTTPIAGQKALAAIKRPLVLIAGGSSKKLDLSAFAKDIASKTNVKKVVLLNGAATDDLQNLIVKYGGAKKIIGRFDDFKSAVHTAYENAQKGQTVLLSPGCASFGMFVNEYDRGNQFKKIVSKLK
jgi:UDP-N-acetylmuramoylalanine--D-glutamate ligase